MSETAFAQWEYHVEDFGGIIKANPRKRNSRRFWIPGVKRGGKWSAPFIIPGRPACGSSPNGRWPRPSGGSAACRAWTA